jgi:crotonobetainyl-CoA:carnitine CoA-transferase CaiB-like acyl-CoA transferase
MGEHTHEIARNLLGLSDDEIEKLDEEKVLY